MLKGRLLHPELLRALGAAGHGAKLLLADGNYPVGTKAPAAAARVYLNLAPGIVTVTDVLDVLVAAIPVEAAEVMVPESGPEPPIFEEFRRILKGATTAPGTGPAELVLSRLSRQGFYEAASSPDVAVAVATGERRIYANILLTIGVVAPEG
ncbi:MAG TPA: RbsD/FucU family protein [Chloroflexota bacterium]|jgi:L-fucose mutarotase|nr:RbsD/FucU family protein [Chloroflexota bacterium]